MTRWEVPLDACRKRARPIIMAIAVIGGLITSTFLSLLVIPGVFTYVDDVGQWTARKFARPSK